MIKKLLLSLLALAVLGLAIFAWQCHLKQDQLQKAKEERETYESLIYYTGTFTIDDYSFLENGTGVVVHWKSENPEEDALVRKYATLKNAEGEVVEIQKTNFFGDFKFDGLDDGKYVLTIDAAGKTKDIDVEIAGKSLNLDFIEF